MGTLKYFQDLGIKHYNKRSHAGVLRHFVVRKALSTGEILVNLVTTTQIDFDLTEYKEIIKNAEYQGKMTNSSRPSEKYADAWLSDFSCDAVGS